MTPTPHKPSVAVVEDDADLRASVVEYLRLLGYDCWGADSVEAYEGQATAQAVDVVVVDVELPGETGFILARRLQQRTDRRVGVVMLTGRGGLDDRVTGLESGADVYLVKPVDLRELAANIDAVSRRILKQESTGTWRLERAQWRWIAPNGACATLTSKEYQFVAMLTEAAGATIAREELLARIWGKATLAGDNRLDVLAYRLRRKCEPLFGGEIPIKAVHGAGYQLTLPGTQD